MMCLPRLITRLLMTALFVTAHLMVVPDSLSAVFANDSVINADQKEQDPESPMILAHYMPWFVAKPSSDHWGWHWTMNHFDPDQESDGKRQIASAYYPIVGPYDSSDPDVLEFHLLLMKLAGIDGVIVDWYGLTDYRDYAILHRNTTRLLQQCERLRMKFVICYEDQTIPALVAADRLAATDRISHAVNELNWLGKYWFKSGSYLKLDGKPVLLSFGHAGLTNEEWGKCLAALDSPVSYFSQDFRRSGAIGGFGWPAPKIGMQQVDQFLADAKHWTRAIPVAFPRFHDVYRVAGVQEGYPRLPDASGQTLQSTLNKAIDSNAVVVQIATWNDWGEGTQIEPSVELGYRDLEIVQRLLRQRQFTTHQPQDLSFPFLLYQARRSEGRHETAERAFKLFSQGELGAALSVLGATVDRE